MSWHEGGTLLRLTLSLGFCWICVWVCWCHIAYKLGLPVFVSEYQIFYLFRLLLQLGSLFPTRGTLLPTGTPVWWRQPWKLSFSGDRMAAAIGRLLPTWRQLLPRRTHLWWLQPWKLSFSVEHEWLYLYSPAPPLSPFSLLALSQKSHKQKKHNCAVGHFLGATQSMLTISMELSVMFKQSKNNL